MAMEPDTRTCSWCVRHWVCGVWLQVLLEHVHMKLTPMQLLQYFGACITDLADGTMDVEEFGYMLVCLTTVQSPTYLLPQDLFYFVDPSRGKLTGSLFAFGTIDVQGLYIALHGCGLPVSQDKAARLIKVVDKANTAKIK
jgi:hypothetical protein